MADKMVSIELVRMMRYGEKLKMHCIALALDRGVDYE